MYIWSVPLTLLAVGSEVIWVRTSPPITLVTIDFSFFLSVLCCLTVVEAISC